MKAFAAIGATVCLFATWLVFAASPTAQLPPLNSPPSTERLPGKFIWFDFATPAIANQRAFYGAVFGWTFESPLPTEDEYVLIMNRGRAVAGMFSYEPSGGEQDGAAWIALMSTADPDGLTATVKANGGSVQIEATNVAGRGRHAVYADPGGAVFGVLRSDSGDPSDSRHVVHTVRRVGAVTDSICSLTAWCRNAPVWILPLPNRVAWRGLSLNWVWAMGAPIITWRNT